MWSNGSLEPSNDSSWGRKNFGGRGWFNTSVVNGQFVLRIIPSRLSIALSFTAFLSSSISLLMLQSSLSILDGFSSNALVLLLAWLSDPSSFWFPSILRHSSSFWFSTVHYHSSFWDLAALFSSSFWRVNSSTLATRAWMCCAACSTSILCYEVFCCHLQKMAWMISVPIDSTKLMMRKNHKLRSSF